MPEHTTPPTATWNPARGVWETDRISLLCGHSERYSPTWPTSGMTRSGTAYALPTSAPATNDSACSSSPSTPAPAALLPTPRAIDGSKGGPNQRGSSGDLMLPSAVARLLPTPTSSDRYGPGRHGSGGADLRTVASLLPTPTARDWKGTNQRGDASCLSGALLPTPQSRDGQGRSLGSPQVAKDRVRSGRRNLDDAICLLPTPTAADSDRTSLTYMGGQADTAGGDIDWGAYTLAVRRWEHILRRPAPVPRITGPRGGLKLNPALCEWMQGFPAGWFTNVPGVGVNDGLRLAGNSVNPVQAAAALRWCLDLLASWRPYAKGGHAA